MKTETRVRKPKAKKGNPGFIVWSNEHQQWWRSGHAGYTSNPLAAGIYSREEAERICIDAGFSSRSMAPNEIMVPADDARIYIYESGKAVTDG